MLGWSLLISLSALISQGAMNGLVQIHSTEEAYIILEMNKIPMNKQYLLSEEHCLPLMKIT
uniref:Uncharacterized protein n=1 Tax=Rhizophora mucronata TaxID=61149 RepID=A0A2P2KTK4_RHIMU